MPDILSFRCSHRHTAESHPNCYQRYLQGETYVPSFPISRHPRSANILIADIETLPGEYYAYSPKVEYLSPHMQIKDWSISCWSAKWLFNTEILGERVTSQEAHLRIDRSILNGIWKLLDKADIVVFHNGVNFDVRKLFTRFVDYDMPPPSRFLVVDTLKVAREIFGHTYNRLDELGKKFGIGKKLEMEFDDWKACLTNDREADIALEHMLEYCKIDVAPLLEDVYLHLLPYMTKHPNLNVYTNKLDVCPKCEGAIQWGGKPYATSKSLYDSFRCTVCGAVGHGTSKEHKLRAVSTV